MDELLNYTLCNDHLFKIVFEEETVRAGMREAERQGVNFSEIVRRSLEDYLKEKETE